LASVLKKIVRQRVTRSFRLQTVSAIHFGGNGLETWRRCRRWYRAYAEEAEDAAEQLISSKFDQEVERE